MKKILVVIDMQNDFITGPLGTPEAVSIVDKVVEKIRGEEWYWVYATEDTHFYNYLDTQEGKKLPVEHCIIGTDGRNIHKDIQKALDELECEYSCFVKSTFGARSLPMGIENDLYDYELNDWVDGEELELTLVGVCTDICVISNALLLKAHYPEMKIVVDASCCAGSTPFRHREAIDVMRSCQVEIVNDINPVEFLEKHFVMPDRSSYY